LCIVGLGADSEGIGVVEDLVGEIAVGAVGAVALSKRIIKK
jgi:hypothetical protein